jgi:hypothetical protein
MPMTATARATHTTSMVTAVAITATTITEGTNHDVHDSHDHENDHVDHFRHAYHHDADNDLCGAFPCCDNLNNGNGLRVTSINDVTGSSLPFRLVLDSGRPRKMCDGDLLRSRSSCGALPPFISFGTDRSGE